MQSGCGHKASLLVADFMKDNASPAHSIGGVVGGVVVMQDFLETERLVLRRFTMADADNLVGLDGDPDVMHFITGGQADPPRGDPQ